MDTKPATTASSTHPAHKIAVLTGAGISTSAGIPDFRGPDGVWTKHPDQMSVYDIDAFLTSKEAREYSWRWQKESPVWNAKPGAAHLALARLEKAGLLTLLATQNFDALHEKAGNSPDVIVNLHGTIGTSHCMKCHKLYNTADIMARLNKEDSAHGRMADDTYITLTNRSTYRSCMLTIDIFSSQEQTEQRQ